MPALKRMSLFIAVALAIGVLFWLGGSLIVSTNITPAGLQSTTDLFGRQIYPSPVLVQLLFGSYLKWRGIGWFLFDDLIYLGGMFVVYSLVKFGLSTNDDASKRSVNAVPWLTADQEKIPEKRDADSQSEDFNQSINHVNMALLAFILVLVVGLVAVWIVSMTSYNGVSSSQGNIQVEHVANANAMPIVSLPVAATASPSPSLSPRPALSQAVSGKATASSAPTSATCSSLLGIAATHTRISIDHATSLSALGAHPDRSVRWGGGGTFSASTQRGTDWQAGTPGTYHLTVREDPGHADCAIGSLDIIVVPPPTRIEGLTSIGPPGGGGIITRKVGADGAITYIVSAIFYVYSG